MMIQRVAYRAIVLITGFLISFLTLSACQPTATSPASTDKPIPIDTLSPTDSPSPISFTYGVTALDADNRPIENARVIIEIEGQAPLDEYTEANGYARIIVPATHAERPGRLTINAQGYEVEVSNIDLYQDRLPDTVRLTAQVVGNTAGFCPDNLTFATGFAAAQEDETLVIVSNFADSLGDDPRNVTFDLVERMTETLFPHGSIRVERLNCAIKQQGGSETAMHIGSRRDVDASIVIWGVYVAPPDPEVRIYFDIVKEKETYLGAGFDRNFGPQAIQPSMFDFKVSLGTQAGQVVAFATGLVLFNASEYLAAESLFTTAVAAVDQPLATDFVRAIRFYRGVNYWHLGHFLDAKSNLDPLKPQQALVNKSLDDLDLFILEFLGGVYSALGDKQQALDFYNQALPMHHEIGNRTMEAITLNNIGMVYSDLGDKPQALDYFNQALPMHREAGNRRMEATTLNNIGEVYRVLGDKQQALDFYNQALPITQEVGNRAREATILMNIGGAYDALGDKPQALDYFNQALPMHREAGNRTMEAATLNNIGGVYQSLGDMPQALDFFNQALPITQEVGERSGEATTLMNIGLVYDALDDKQQALDYFNQALLMHREVGNRTMEATTLMNIGGVYSDLDDKQQALDYFNQALLMHREVGNRTMEAVTHHWIAFILFEGREYEKAKSQLSKAIELFAAVRDPRLSEAQQELEYIQKQQEQENKASD